MSSISDIDIHYIHKINENLSISLDKTILIGCNPSLPEIIYKTWKWPFFSVIFKINNLPLAYFSACQIKNKWVSLPHFSYSAMWIDYNCIEKEFTSAGRTAPSIINCWQALFSSFLRLLPQQKQTESYILRTINLEIADFDDKIYLDSISLDFISRNELQLAAICDTSKTLSLLTLKDSWQKQMSFFSTDLRRKIRKSFRNDIKIKTGDIELLHDFYESYRIGIHNHGSFGLPLSFFEALLNNYQFGEIKIFLAFHSGKVIGSSLLFTYLGYAENAFFATIPAYNKLYTTYALHEAMIQFAINNKCHTYSFGHSTIESTVHKYKKQWNTYDQLIYLNATKKQISLAQRYKFILPMIKKLPLKAVSLFDHFVSTKVY